MIETQHITEKEEDKMVAIVKSKICKDVATDINLVWVYKTLEEALHSGSQIYESHLERKGYRIMRRGKQSDQYCINLSFVGEKDKTFLAIEKSLRPLIRDKRIEFLLN